MATKHQRFSKTSFPPGDEIRDALKARGWSQEEFAARIGCHVQGVNRILTGRRPITLPTAQKLERELGKSAEYWMNLSPRKNGPRPLNPKAGDINEFLNAILSDYQARNARPSTIPGIRRALRIFPRAGITRIEDLNDEGIERVQKWVDNNPDLCPRTRVQYLKTLKTVCRIGYDKGLLPEKLKFTETRPAKSFPNTKDVPRIDRSDARRLLRYLQKETGTWKGHRLYAFVITAMFTGLFRLELFDLRVDDLDLDGGLLRVRRRERFKASAYRKVIRLGDKPKAVLKSWAPLTGCEWLFPGVERRGPWAFEGNYANNARNVIRAAGEAVGISGLTFKSFHKFYHENVELSLSHFEQVIQNPRVSPAVVIRRSCDPAMVLGQQRTFHTPNEYKVIKALLDEFPVCLTEEQLRTKSRVKTARRVLESMRFRDPLWLAATKVPGKGFPGSDPGLGIVALS
jgi:addiction module HigA family antidote